ncbi:serine phosphatase rsbU, regulator of sigma subunit [Streptomyces laurentii]|uniref:Serine phosphatase rsbU, regulator of sigma subunit n=1 Tax=Streptomyces laurentii TaxID=39478 RepID=A0A160P2M2_STRLU|nr:serine phosphatase rsbU, regulator of sigma subunit [Streptomyces laurentii]
MARAAVRRGRSPGHGRAQASGRGRGRGWGRADDGAALGPYRGARRFLRALPPLVIAGGVAYDLLTPPMYTAAPLLPVAPLVAAPFFSTLTTLLTGIAAVLASTGLLFFHKQTNIVLSITETLTVVTVSALAVLISRVVQRSGERLASARVIAEAAQRAVLPEPAERICGLRIAARYEAAQAGAFIGGDLFAVQDTPHGVRLVVGDVRGKGMDAVEAVAVVIGAFREAAEQEATLAGVAARLERALAREGERRDDLDAFEGFTTAVLAEFPGAGEKPRGTWGPGGCAGLVRVINRGHPEPLLLYADGGLLPLRPSEPALPLGLGDVAEWPDRADETPYPPGATLLFYTDGLSEARDAHGVFYDPAERLTGRIFPGPEELLDALVADVRRHTGGATTDDMALLAVGRPGAGEPERRRTMPVVPADGPSDRSSIGPSIGPSGRASDGPSNGPSEGS